jgi:hypothetical protein
LEISYKFSLENRHPHAQPQGLRRVGIQVLVVVWLKQIFFGNFIEIFSRKSSSPRTTTRVAPGGDPSFGCGLVEADFLWKFHRNFL